MPLAVAEKGFLSCVGKFDGFPVLKASRARKLSTVISSFHQTPSEIWGDDPDPVVGRLRTPRFL